MTNLHKITKMIMDILQRFGKSLVIPAVVIPIAGLMLRLGQSDVLDINLLYLSGNAVFEHLDLVFAVGVAVGMVKNNHGAAGLVGVISYYIINSITVHINRDIDYGILTGMISGILAGICFNEFKDLKLPEYLGFFSGSRSVPVIVAAISFIMGYVLGAVYPVIRYILDFLSNSIDKSDLLGVFLFGFLHKILTPLGLHYILSTFVFFQHGNYNGSEGEISRFLHMDPTAGSFMTGQFSIFMFALPAAALAIYLRAYKENRKKVSKKILYAALTSMFTGVTEPVEFLFAFISFPLYLFNAISTGICMVICKLLGIRCGFTFSAGLFDYLLNFNISSKPLMIIPVGIIFGVIYFLVFFIVIKRMGLRTLGREESDIVDLNKSDDDEDNIDDVNLEDQAKWYIAKLGGANNINEISACITRLRVIVKDMNDVDIQGLKDAGAYEVINVNDTSLQVIIGTKADIIVDKIRDILY